MELIIKQPQGNLHISNHQYNKEKIYLNFGCDQISIHITKLDEVIEALKK